MTTIETLAAYAVDGVRGNVSPDTDDLIKLHVIDSVGALVASTATIEARRLIAYRPLLRQQLSDLFADITINCALARLTEVDDIHLASMTTPGAFIVPSALAIAAANPATDALALREAIVVGYEAMTRLGAAINGPTVLYRGIWPSYFSGAFGVAATAARLMDLDVRQAAHALAFALNVAAPGVGHHGSPTTSRWLAAGGAARNGLLAAQAAAAGFTSDLAILDGKYFSNVYGMAPEPERLTSELGERVALSEVGFKPWCAARQTMAATQAFKELIAHAVDPTGVTAVEVAAPPLFMRMIDHGTVDNDRLSRLTSMPYQLAVAALAPERAFDLLQTDEVPAALQEFMRKVRLAPDESLLDGFPAIWRARVRVQAGGSWHEHQIAQIPGDPGRPFVESDIRDKFHRLADAAVGADLVDRVIADAIAVVEGAAASAQLSATIATASVAS